MKKNNEDNVSICGICNKLIFKNVDDYCHLEDYVKGKFYMDGWYHLKCYNDKIKGNAQLDVMKKQTMALLKKASEMVGINKEEENMEVIRI